MNRDESRVSRLFRDVVPEPPVAVDVDAVLELTGAGHLTSAAGGRRRLIAPIAAAVAVVVVAVGLVVASSLSHRGGGQPGSAAAPNAVASSQPVTSTAPSASGLPSSTTPSDAGSTPTPTAPRTVGPWETTLTTNHALQGTQLSLIGSSTAGYALTDSSLVRFDPTSDAVSATASTGALGPDPVFTVAGGTLWVAAANTGQNAIHVRELDADNLSTQADLSIAVDGTAPRTAIAADPSGTSVLVGAGDVVARIDVKTATVAGQFTVSPGHVGTVAATTDGNLYVAMDNDYGTVALQLRNASSGAVLSSTSYGNWIDQIVPTRGGIWLSSHAATEASVRFFPNANLNDLSVAAFSGASSPGPTVTIVQGVAWIGTSNGIACAAPDTGKVLDQAQTTNIASYDDIAQANGHWVADFFSNDGEGIATFSPPSSCSN